MLLEHALLVSLAILLQPSPTPKAPAATFNLERLATCQDSWYEWKDDRARMMALAQGLRAAYHQQSDSDGFFVPNDKTTLIGFSVLRVFPESIGMAVGFSVIVDGAFDAVKKAVESVVHKPLTKCETGDDMHTCGLEIADKKTVTLLGDATGKSTEVLIGCYYLYEK